MSGFIPKKIYYKETLGEKLRIARQQQNLKIEEISKKINIRTEYLYALEEERFDNLPAGLYGKNFLKEYSSFLKLNVKEMEKNYDESFTKNLANNPFSRKILARHKFIILPKIFRNILIIGAIAICFLYLIFYFKKITSAPQLIITQPKTNLAINENNLVINGQTETEAEVRINGVIVLNNHNGYFTQTINLKKGLNNISIISKKKYSREQIVTRQILVN
jgi:cytoskeletal protein RodZ